jgi:hypothetical protein
VGGLNTSGLNTAESEHMLKWTFGGIALEFYRRMGERYGSGKPEFYFESSVAEKTFNDMLREAGVRVQFNVRVEKVVKRGGEIRSVTLDNGATVAAKVFVDASYEGDLMARAGVKYAVGREAVAEFGEEAAGIHFEKSPTKAVTVDENGKLLPGISGWAKDFKEGDAHRGVMNYNWRLTFSIHPATRVPLPVPQHYDRARFRLLKNWLCEKTARGEKVAVHDLLDLYPGRNGKIEVNNKQAAIISIGHFGGQFDYPEADYALRARIIADHVEYTLGLLYFLSHDEAVPAALRAEMCEYGLHKDEFVDNGHWPYQMYVREARRMRGTYVVTQKDVISDRRKPDSIAVASHFIDSHHVQRLAVSPTEFVNEGRLWRSGWAYQVPYRAITPKVEECTNLLVPGAASYTHVAFCTLRLESTWMMVGHAAGVAAAMLANDGRTAQRLDVAMLQAKLRRQKQVVDFLPGQPEQFGKAHEKEL